MILSPEDEMAYLLRNNFQLFLHRVFQTVDPGATYIHNWHLDLFSAKLDACRQGEIKRLIVNVPPRQLKSVSFSVAYAAWLLGHNPSEQIICASYGQDLADKHSFDCRKVLASEWYRQIFPNTKILRASNQEIVTTRGGFRLATSVNGTLTGRGGTFAIIDDPLKPDGALSDTIRNDTNDWYRNTLSSRFNSSADGCRIIVMQRLHENDLSGFLLAQGGWEHISIPAIAETDETYNLISPLGNKYTFCRKVGEALHPEREPLKALEQLKRDLGEYVFAGQYQQSPAPLDGGIIKRRWLNEYLPHELPQWFEVKIISLDAASKADERNDYSVFTTWGKSNGKIYLLDVYRAKLEFPDLKREALNQKNKHRPDVILIEDCNAGTQLIQELRREGIYVHPMRPSTDKVTRMFTKTVVMEAGNVYIPHQAPWKDEYVRELLIFPNGTYDDQVDSTSQALEYLTNMPMARIRSF